MTGLLASGSVGHDYPDHPTGVEALIMQHMKSGGFVSPEDVILHALRISAQETRTGAALIAAMQSSPHKDIEIEPSRGVMPIRDVSL